MSLIDLAEYTPDGKLQFVGKVVFKLLGQRRQTIIELVDTALHNSVESQGGWDLENKIYFAYLVHVLTAACRIDVQRASIRRRSWCHFSFALRKPSLLGFDLG
eukprot:GEZU01002781.1.p1 GENE.GEZU01002781.1~~GEZU01002781.1.p1  ORF type:complete len:103 (-),score=3.44 GEZU01002781.1:34-342(-)